MLVALHNGKGWNQQWIQYCVKKKINHVVLDFYSSDIINSIKELKVTHLLWYFHHAHYRDKMMARNVLFSAQKMGIKVYPDFDTCWYFDDKVSEKYMFEAIGAPLAKTDVFYDKKSASDFLKQVNYPLVFKLRGGAGAANVRLVRSYKQAMKLVSKAFSSGFPQFNSTRYLHERIQKYSIGKGDIKSLLKGIGRLVIPTEFSKLYPKEIGYVLFQEYIENEGFDIRIEMVGDKCWGEKRGVRANDFRASGSGLYNQNPENISKDIVKLAFDLKDKLNAQSMAFDFVIDKQGNAKVIEMSYAFGFVEGDGEFYWDRNLVLHSVKINAAYLILEDLIEIK